MKTLKITAEYKSLGEAVRASNIDFSYNEGLAMQDIKLIDRNCKRAWLIDDGSVWFTFSADIEILQEFTPFVSCLHDGEFSIVTINEGNISISNPIIPKNKAGRKLAKQNGFIVASI